MGRKYCDMYCDKIKLVNFGIKSNTHSYLYFIECSLYKLHRLISHALLNDHTIYMCHKLTIT
jgi:hypothetical protein